jgi:hypothetical protein
LLNRLIEARDNWAEARAPKTAFVCEISAQRKFGFLDINIPKSGRSVEPKSEVTNNGGSLSK